MIYITTTAVRRPKILRQTFTSFRDNLFGNKMVECHLCINVDPVGGPDSDTYQIDRICREFFNNYTIRLAPQPNFATAWQWCWSMVGKDCSYVLHLEDDWKLVRPILLDDLISILNDYPRLASIRLPAFHANDTNMKNWNRFFWWNGRYYECPENLISSCGFCGHPALIRANFVREAAPKIWTTHNPEKQFHYWNKPLIEQAISYDYGVYGPPNNDPAIVDIGRDWLKKAGWRKKGEKAFFMSWEPGKVR